jgi:hypothetical protein
LPGRLRYFLQRDANLQGAALRRFLWVVEQCLRAHSPGSGPAARLGAVAFVHRFGPTLDSHVHSRCAVIGGVFDAAITGGVIFSVADRSGGHALRKVLVGVVSIVAARS